MFSRIIYGGAAIMAVAITVITTGSALAGKGGGSLATTISLGAESRTVEGSSGPMVYGDATFTVTRSIPFDRETIWVTNQCWDAAGNKVVDRDAAVMWGTSVSLVGSSGPMPTGGVRCTAYVTLRPWQDRVLGDSIVHYAVGQ